VRNYEDVYEEGFVGKLKFCDREEEEGFWTSSKYNLMEDLIIISITYFACFFGF
jgi:hypothetical protein